MLAVHGFNDAANGSEMVIDVRLRGIDIPSLADVGFATAATPGARSRDLFSDLVPAPLFSRTRGIYDEPFTLELTTPTTPAAAIYFTLDGSNPTPDNPRATRYQGPLDISKTTLLRAAAFQDGLLPSLPQTHTYIFPSDVIKQSTLNPVVVDNPVWGPQLTASLKALPTLSLVTSKKITRDEIGTSVEFISPDGSEPGFQVDAGVEEFGGEGSTFPKRSMRLSFKKIYGPSKLKYDVFGDPGGVTEFDQLLLRGGSQDSPFWTNSVATGLGTYIRNRWVFDRQLELGQPSPRGRFVQLYLNGVYWGMYHLLERANASFAASEYGGSKADYDVMKAGVPLDGDAVAWNELLDSLDDGYDAVKQHLDVVNYADYILVQFYGGNFVDWGPNSNWIATRRREPGARFRFIPWDNDVVLRSPSDIRVDIVNFPGPGHLWTLHGGVRQYPEFRQLLAERAQKLFFDGGILTDARVRSQIDAFIDELQLPVIAETARFGAGTYTPDTWLGAVKWIKENYAPEGGPSRAATVVEQLRRAGLFPLTDKPQFVRDGQPVGGDQVAPGTEITATAPQGDIYFTLDGSDPRAAIPTVDYTSLVTDSSPARVLVPTDDSLQSAWQAPGFDDSGWISGVNGVGYDTDANAADPLTPLINLDIHEQMQGVNATAYLRMPFQVDDPDQFDTLEFSMRYDDGFVAYLNGTEVARRNAPTALTWNSHATRVQLDVESREFETFNLTPFKDLLRSGKNVLAIQALNFAVDNIDLLMTPRLRAGRVADPGVAPTAIRYSEPIVVPPGATIKARTVLGDQWSTLGEVAATPQIFPLRVSEIMYHPADPTDAERAAGFTNMDDFEYIELVNISDAPLDLTDVQFVKTTDGGQTEGVQFDFGQGAIGQLDPGQRVLVVENRSAFETRYGTDLPVAGMWNGGLSNASEQLTLVVNGDTIQQFRYQDTWYPTTDGAGNSLEILDAQSDSLDLWGQASGWLPSIRLGGTPGTARSSATVQAGDLNLDGVTDVSDIAGLVLGLNDPEAYAARYGVSAALGGDTDGDGDLDNDDIRGFVVSLAEGGGASSAVAARGGEGRHAERRWWKNHRHEASVETTGAEGAAKSSWEDLADHVFGGDPL